MLRQAGSNWVEGDRFFDRAADLQALERRVDNRAHTLLTAQRRMGKTSLIRELFRRFEESGKYRGVFVDLEAARNSEDAVTEIAVQCRKQQSIWRHVGRVFGDLAASVDEVSIANLRIRLRSQVDAGNWAQRGDELFEILAKRDQPTVLAIDELPMLVTAILKDEDFEATPERLACDGSLSGLAAKEQSSLWTQDPNDCVRQRGPPADSPGIGPQRLRQYLLPFGAKTVDRGGSAGLPRRARQDRWSCALAVL